MPEQAETSSELVILRELLTHETGFVSGSTLAAKLGVSRVAVWQHMEKLRTQGFAFQAVRARGYRIIRRPTELSAPFLEALLANSGTDCRLVLLDEVDSTNDEAARQLSAGMKTPFVVIARTQTRGRGRFGRPYDSQKEGNLYASFAFRPDFGPERMQRFTLWMGLNVCELLAAHCHSAPGLKWPNGLMFGDRKTGGLLTEARMDSDMIRDLILGVGIDMTTAETEGAHAAVSPHTCLAEHTREAIDLNRFTATLIERVIAASTRMATAATDTDFRQLWERYDLLRNRRVTLTLGERRCTGLAQGIDEDGALLLRDENGSLQRFRAGELTLDEPAPRTG